MSTQRIAKPDLTTLETSRTERKRLRTPPHSLMSDQALMKSMAEGDKHAMALLYARHQLRLYRFVLRLSGHAALAEDIVSCVFLDLWRSAGRFDGRSRVSTWLLSIARHRALSALRRRPDEPLDGPAVALAQDPLDDPESAAERSVRNGILRRCLAQLSPSHREVVDLVYYHEQTVDDVSRIVGISPNTVKTRMFYARRRLAGLLVEAGIAGC